MTLVKTLREELPKAFRQEAFDKEKSSLTEKFNNRAQELNAQFATLARERGFQVQTSTRGHIYFIPVVDGKPLQRPQDFAALSEDERRDVERRQQELNGRNGTVGAQTAGNHARDGDRTSAASSGASVKICLVPILRRIDAKFGNERSYIYLDEVHEPYPEQSRRLQRSRRRAPMALPFHAAPRERDPYLEYEVNVVVDNAKTKGAPILVESAPTYLNLFGTIERVVDRFGRVVTNFTRIKSGSFLRAHGGYLIFSLEDAITEPAVWKVLKRTLRSGRIEMETYEPFALFSASGLKPEPVKVNTKVIVVGSAFSITCSTLGMMNSMKCSRFAPISIR